MSQIKAIRKVVREIERRQGQIKAKRELVQEQIEEATKEAADRGYTGLKSLRKAVESKKTREAELEAELLELVGPFMPGGAKRHLLEDIT